MYNATAKGASVGDPLLKVVVQCVVCVELCVHVQTTEEIGSLLQSFHRARCVVGGVRTWEGVMCSGGGGGGGLVLCCLDQYIFTPGTPH